MGRKGVGACLSVSFGGRAKLYSQPQLVCTVARGWPLRL